MRKRFTFISAAALAASIIGSAPPASAGTAPGHVEFELFREGHFFGRQSVTVTERDGALIGESRASLHAGLGPLTLFSYTQSCTETWREARLASLHCATRKNGHPSRVSGEINNGFMRVRAADGAVADFAASVLPTSWWTRPPLTTREMINSETGARLPVRVSLIGRETIVANGQRIAADHLRVEGTVAVDLWYDDAGHWLGCAFTIQGQHITFRLLTPPASAPS